MFHDIPILWNTHYFLIYEYCFSLREWEDMGEVKLVQPKRTSHLGLKQGLANYSYWSICPPSASANKVLLELSHTHVLTPVHGCFSTTTAELSVLQQRSYDM